jgi:hypothetical protein
MSGLGVSYLPPTEDVPIFDSSLYIQNNTPLTYADAIKEFLTYPQAQGTETLLDTNVNGLLTANAGIAFPNSTSLNTGLNYITFSGAGTGGLYTLPTSSYNSLTSITNASITGITLPTKSSIYYGSPLYIQNNLTTSITITSSGGNFIGKYSVGASTTITLTAGLTFGFFIDAGSSNSWNIYQTSTSPTPSLSQVLLAGNSAGGVSINMNYQNLGSVATLDFGYVPTVLRTATNFRSINNGSTSTLALATSSFDSLTSITSSVNVAITLPIVNLSPIVYNKLPVLIQNTSNYTYTLTIGAGDGSTFLGKYGSLTNSVILESGSTYGFFYDSGWNFYYKEITTLTLSSTSLIDYSTNYNIGNSTLRMTGVSAQSITLPNLSLSATAVLTNSQITIQNTTDNNITLTSGVNFVGHYGSYTTTLIVYPYTIVTLLCSNSKYEVITRVEEELILTQALSGTTYNILYDQINSSFYFSGSVATTVTVPSPQVITNSNTYIVNNFYKLYNNGTALLTVTTSVGAFGGQYGNLTGTIPLPSNCWIELRSNGTNWAINTRGGNFIYYIPIAYSTNYDFTSYRNYLNATIYFTGVVTAGAVPSITIPSPATNINTITTIYNNLTTATSTETEINLFTANSSNFEGKYGTGASQFQLASTNWIELTSFNNGANYLISKKSIANLNIATTISPTDRSYLDSYCFILYNFGTLNLPTVTLMNNTVTTLVNSSTNVTITNNSSSNFGGLYGSGTTSFILPANSIIVVSVKNEQIRIDSMNNIGNPSNISTPITTNTTLLSTQLNTKIYLNMTNSSSVNRTIIVPQSSGIVNQSYQLKTISTSKYVTLTAQTGTFIGAFGSGTSTLILPINSGITMYSNGTDWNCETISESGWSAYQAQQTISTSTQYFRNFTFSSFQPANNAYYTIFSRSPLSNHEGLLSNFRCLNGYNTSGAVSVFILASNPTFSSGVLSNIIPYYSNLTADGTSSNQGCVIVGQVNSNYLTVVSIYVKTIKIGYVGTNSFTASGTSGSRFLTIAGMTNTAGNSSLGINSTVLVSGTTYTITGMPSVPSGTVSCTNASTTITFTTYTNTNTVLMSPGVGIIIDGNEYLIIASNSFSGTAGNAFTITPAFIGITNIGYTFNTIGGSTSYTTAVPCGGNGVYTVQPPLITTYSSVSTTVTGESFAYSVGPY